MTRMSGSCRAWPEVVDMDAIVILLLTATFVLGYFGLLSAAMRGLEKNFVEGEQDAAEYL
ncbi:MAG TPA: hypothetical protein VF998_07345 [Candidatus Limnocylindria bacterium]